MSAGPFEDGFAGIPGEWIWDAEDFPVPLSPAQTGLLRLLPLRHRVVGGYLFRRVDDAEVASDRGGIMDVVRPCKRVEAARSLGDALGPFLDLQAEHRKLAARGARDGQALIDWIDTNAPDARAQAIAVLSAQPSHDRRLSEVARGTLELGEYLELYGGFSFAWDAAAPTYAEDASSLRAALPALARRPERGSMFYGHWVPESALARAGGFPSPERDPDQAIAARISEAGLSSFVAEHIDQWRARAQAKMRRLLLDLGERIGLAAPEDVFFLDDDAGRLAALDRAPAGGARRAAEARELQRQQRSVVPPRRMIGGRIAEATILGAMRGLGTGGRARGTVVRLDRTGAIERLCAAATPVVLVAPTLVAGQTFAVGLAAGLVVAHGGWLGRAARLAREAGIPAVVGASGSLDLDEGSDVVVDADAGKVERVA